MDLSEVQLISYLNFLRLDLSTHIIYFIFIYLFYLFIILFILLILFYIWFINQCSVFFMELINLVSERFYCLEDKVSGINCKLGANALCFRSFKVLVKPSNSSPRLN